jgi:hypothetical protein
MRSRLSHKRKIQKNHEAKFLIIQKKKKTNNNQNNEEKIWYKN